MAEQLIYYRMYPPTSADRRSTVHRAPLTPTGLTTFVVNPRQWQ